MVGAGATVAVGLGVFFAVSASNAEELDPAPVTPAGHYSTLESQDPIEYIPEPIPAPEPVVVEEPVVSEPAPAPEPVVEPAPEVTQGAAPPADSGAVVIQPGTEMPPMPPGTFYVPPPLP